MNKHPWKMLAGMAALVLLSGCGQSYSADLTMDVSRRLTEVLQEPVHQATHNHRYYRYYLEPSIGRLESYATSNVFCMDGVKFAMNLNVSRILAQEIYETTEEAASVPGRIPETDLSGTYTDYEGESHDYTIRIYLLGEKYYTLVDTDYVMFCGISNQLQAAQLAAECIKIARTVSVDVDEVRSAFSGREILTGTRRQINLFEELTPENGAIEELFDTNHFSGSGEEGEATPYPAATPEPRASESISIDTEQ